MKGYPPPVVAYRDDGSVSLGGWCGADGGRCQLIAQRDRDGTVQLAFHGTQQHSIHLSTSQQAALLRVLAEPVIIDSDD